MQFKIKLETGKKGSESRNLFVRADSIIGAMDISNKVRGSKLKEITPITYEEYMAGVRKKYDN